LTEAPVGETPDAGTPSPPETSGESACTFTLAIEHAVTDFRTWKTAFDRFADARTQAGVVSDRIRHPVDDPHHLVIELDFRTQGQAEAFRQFLTTVVWANPAASPALSGSPSTRILAAATSTG
jgi:hypothetical protein